ncbi:unnamed protein product [Nyctereutes procyonoides]|uniref:Nucleolar complex protein 3 homolog n=1 Tax=Nyctereutes procyonoides TaxID=34880 RepID=A0A811Y7G8_NYCPR|nr:unnamed protein product [Nyctereutes procyonoides]
MVKALLERRNKKQILSFWKFLKTSKVRLENKLKNKKVRQAVKDAVSKKPIPLEDLKEKRPEEKALPLDMMNEDDLQLLIELGQRASFLTRDLSSNKYEKIPRTLQTAPEKELIHLLPIKDKSVIDNNQDEEDQEEVELEEEIEKKMHIAALASAILSDPETNIKKLKELCSVLMEQDPDVTVTVQKLVIVSLMEEFEEGLVSQCKFYLENMDNVVSLKAYKGLAEVAVKSLCELLVSLPHFNFHNNIIVLIVPLMNDVSKSISGMCCEAVRKLFKQDKSCQASHGVIKVISGVVKGRNYEVRPEMLKTFLCLRIKEVEVKKAIEDINKPKKFMTFKEKRKTLSRMKKKWKKAEEKLERELLEAETLNIVFVTYFRILKKAQSLAHLIKVEFFDDLLVVLHKACVQTAFHMLSGQGDVLNIDLRKFYTHLYKTLFKLHAGATNEVVAIVLQCLDVMLTKCRKQVSQQRALAFIKHLCTLVLHNKMYTFPKTDLLLDSESQGSGVFLPELDEPKYCNAQNTALWELHALQRHYHPIMRRFAAHLMAGAPSEGSAALKPELSQRSAAELFETYSMAAMTFPVESSSSKRKNEVLQGYSFLNEDLNQLIKRHCHEAATQLLLDSTKYLKTSLW